MEKIYTFHPYSTELGFSYSHSLDPCSSESLLDYVVLWDLNIHIWLVIRILKVV
jgi:hypothetical protein